MRLLAIASLLVLPSISQAKPRPNAHSRAAAHRPVRVASTSRSTPDADSAPATSEPRSRPAMVEQVWDEEVPLRRK